MKKFLLIVLGLIVLGGIVVAWIFLASGTAFSAERKVLYIRSTAASKEAVMDSLEKNEIISNTGAFSLLAGQLNYWENIKPGRYEIEKGSSLLSIVRQLRNGRQTPVKLVIVKLRTPQDFVRLTSTKFEFDATEINEFIGSPQILANYGADTADVLWNVLPDTYEYLWNSSPKTVYEKLHKESQRFWTSERKSKAANIGLTPKEAYVLASIVEEETNNQKEKDTIASVYLNRIRKGMPLQADPTVKYALRDFSIKWIRGAMLDVQSPYNTYRNRGLPPGPICTPSKNTIDEVLNAASTDYLYFVANSAFDGSHVFSKTYDEHLIKAKAYQLEDKRRREARNRDQ